MNIYTPKNSINKTKSRLPQYASVIFLILMAGCQEEKKDSSTITEHASTTTTIAPAQPVSNIVSPTIGRDLFFVDIGDENFDAVIRSKIQFMSAESPSVQRLVSLIQNNPKILPFQFLNKDGILAFQKSRGIPESNTENHLRDAGALTSIQKDSIGIYLSEYAFNSKEHFVEAISNEFLNIYFDAEMKSILQKKIRPIDSRGGINLTEDDINGLGIEIMKEFMSGFISTAIMGKYKGNNQVYSLRAIKQNLINGRFNTSDQPGYAFEYTSRILVTHGFPHPQDYSVLIGFHQHIVSLIWPNIDRNLRSFCQYFEIQLEE